MELRVALQILFHPLLLALCALQAAAGAEELPLKTIAEIRALRPEQAAAQMKLRVRGVITCFDVPAGVGLIQDATGGIFFSPGPWEEWSGREPLRPGDFVELFMHTESGGFAPTLQREGDGIYYRVLSHEPLPEPLPLDFNPAENMTQHNCLVRVTGVVRAAQVDSQPAWKGRGPDIRRLALTVSTREQTLRAIVRFADPAWQQPRPEWVGQEASIVGVRVAEVNERHEITGIKLYVPGPEFITIDSIALEKVFAEPARPLDAVMTFDPQANPGRRVHVHGVVTHTEPELGVFLADPANNRHGLLVRTPQTDAWPPGTEVNAVGFPALDRGVPLLRDGVLRRFSEGPPPEPYMVTAAQALSGRMHHRLVQIDGTFLGAVDQGGRQLLSFDADGTPFTAERPRSTGASAGAPWPAGAELRLAGVCVNQFAGPQASGPAQGFSLLLSEAAVPVLLHLPPWWTARRIVTAGLVLAAVALGAAAWVFFLRREVARQAQVIAIAAKDHAISEERNRIARDLHDTLEQHLAGIALQLDGLEEDATTATGAALRRALQMLGHTRREARRSVWDLRSRTLLEEGLVASLRELGAAASGKGTQTTIGITGAVRRLETEVEFTFLRIAQEAVANALKHARAATVAISLDFAGDGPVTLGITDDGCGFCQGEAHQLDQGMGLQSMQDRARRILATWSLQSTPGQGTAISVRWAPPVPAIPAP